MATTRRLRPREVAVVDAVALAIVVTVVAGLWTVAAVALVSVLRCPSHAWNAARGSTAGTIVETLLTGGFGRSLDRFGIRRAVADAARRVHRRLGASRGRVPGTGRGSPIACDARPVRAQSS